MAPSVSYVLTAPLLLVEGIAERLVLPGAAAALVAARAAGRLPGAVRIPAGLAAQAAMLAETRR